MLTDAEIRAANPAVDEIGQLALTNLVKRSTAYRAAIGYYGDVAATIASIVTAGNAVGATGMQIAKARALGAIRDKLNATISIVVESEGSRDETTYYSTPVNWEDMAQDVLDVLVDTPVSLLRSFMVITRDLGGCGCGVCPFCRRGPDDELYLATNGPYRRTAGPYC